MSTVTHAPIVQRIHPCDANGGQRIFRFANNYGASVVQFRGSYVSSYGGSAGLSALAVIVFTGPNADDFNLVYDTPITDDVLGWLTEEDVQRTLDAIQALPAREATCPAL